MDCEDKKSIFNKIQIGMTDNMIQVMRLLQFTDSTFPVGTFSFSNGLETASFERIVYDAETLENFTKGTVTSGGIQRRSGSHSYP